MQRETTVGAKAELEPEIRINRIGRDRKSG